ncbi:MAG TPA: DNA ligase D, partial [Acidobacteriaceae bacterium]
HSVPADAKRGAHWIKPVLVAQVRFATWTSDNLVRQASFKGLREDKPAKEVGRERVVSPEEADTSPADAPETPRKSASTKIKSAAAKTVKPNSPAAESLPIRLTHPDKVLDTASGMTKQILAEYYWAIAKYMLPHIAQRPLSLVRCPEGSGKPCFFQKHKNAMLPPGVEAIDVPDRKTGKTEQYITLSTPEALAGMAQMSVLEIHPWGSMNDDLEHPDRIIFDLDPDPAIPWKVLSTAALDVRKRLKALGLESFLKTTGGKGLHVVVPIRAEYPWPVIKQFAHAVVLQMERDQPQLYLTRMTKSARKDKIYLDYLRNDRGSTSVAAYSPRARAGANVSMPLAWSELNSASLPTFSVHDFATWRKRLTKDPWKDIAATPQRITAATLRQLKIDPEVKAT